MSKRPNTLKYVPKPVVVKEEVVEDEGLLSAAANVLSTQHLVLLRAIWASNPRMPTLTSRNAWANAHGAPTRLVNAWFRRRRTDARSKGMLVGGEYELSVESAVQATSAPEMNKAVLLAPVASRSSAASHVMPLPTPPRRQGSISSIQAPPPKRARNSKAIIQDAAVSVSDYNADYADAVVLVPSSSSPADTKPKKKAALARQSKSSNGPKPNAKKADNTSSTATKPKGIVRARALPGAPSLAVSAAQTNAAYVYREPAPSSVTQLDVSSDRQPNAYTPGPFFGTSNARSPKNMVMGLTPSGFEIDSSFRPPGPFWSASAASASATATATATDLNTNSTSFETNNTFAIGNLLGLDPGFDLDPTARSRSHSRSYAHPGQAFDYGYGYARQDNMSIPTHSSFYSSGNNLGHPNSAAPSSTAVAPRDGDGPPVFDSFSSNLSPFLSLGKEHSVNMNIASAPISTLANAKSGGSHRIQARSRDLPPANAITPISVKLPALNLFRHLKQLPFALETKYPHLDPALTYTASTPDSAFFDPNFNFNLNSNLKDAYTNTLNAEFFLPMNTYSSSASLHVFDLSGPFNSGFTEPQLPTYPSYRPSSTHSLSSKFPCSSAPTWSTSPAYSSSLPCSSPLPSSSPLPCSSSSFMLGSSSGFGSDFDFRYDRRPFSSSSCSPPTSPSPPQYTSSSIVLGRHSTSSPAAIDHAGSTPPDLDDVKMNVGFHADDYDSGRAVSQNGWENLGLSSVPTDTSSASTIDIFALSASVNADLGL